MVVGSRAAVFHNNADQTAGGLRKKDLYKNKRGRIVSMKKSKTAKKWNPLKMMGLLSKSGEPFGARTIKGKRKSRKHRGGTLSYSNYPSDVPNFSNGTGDSFASNPQMRALQAGAGTRRKCRHGKKKCRICNKRGGTLSMTPFNEAYAPSTNNVEFGANTPLIRSLNAGA